MSHQSAGIFVSALLHSSTVAHMLHLASKSYSQHKALGHYYEDILDVADKWAEVYQAHYGLIPLTDYIDDFKVQKDPKAYMSGLLKFAQGMRNELPDDPDLQNIHDEIVGLMAATLYKLTNLS
jgi:hypothetical protein